MCLLVFAWNVHPRHRLIFAGNRDEFHDRPAAPLQWWVEEAAADENGSTPTAGGDESRPDESDAGRRARPHTSADILAGRDLQAGGTWLGLSRGGNFGVVTNFRDMQLPQPGARSRGELVTKWLEATISPQAFAAELGRHAAAYAGFNLLIADADEMVYASNRAMPFSRRLEPGVYGLSNHLLDTPWPKLARTRARFTRLIAGRRPSPGDLEQMLADRQPANEAELPSTGVPPEFERMLSAPFIVDTRSGVQAKYGTRCTTVVLVENGGRTSVRERRFDPAGRTTGMEEISFEPLRSRTDATRT